MCSLCKEDRESTKHIFLNCPFTQLVWDDLKNILNLDIGWNGNIVVDSFINWSFQNYKLITLPTYVCWYIWVDRNKELFEDLSPSVQRIFYLSRSAMDHSWKPHEGYTPRNLVPTFPAEKSLAWFDGAAQQNGHISGVGGILKLD